MLKLLPFGDIFQLPSELTKCLSLELPHFRLKHFSGLSSWISFSAFPSLVSQEVLVRTFLPTVSPAQKSIGQSPENQIHLLSDQTEREVTDKNASGGIVTSESITTRSINLLIAFVLMTHGSLIFPSATKLSLTAPSNAALLS